MTKPVVSIDIETIPDEGKIDTFMSFARPPKEEAESKSGLEAWRIKQMSLNPEYCQIVGLNWMIARQDPHSVWVGDVIKEKSVVISETMLLEKAWHLFNTHLTIVTYNGLAFDIPAIMYRSAEFELHQSKNVPMVDFSNLKPWENRVIDLMKKLFQNRRAKSLKEVRASSVILTCRIPEEFQSIDEMTGDSVYELYKKGDFETLKLYGRFDAWTNDAVYHWGKGYWW